MPKRRKKKAVSIALPKPIEIQEEYTGESIQIAPTPIEPEPPTPDPKLLEKIGKLETDLAAANNKVAELTKQVRKLENSKIELHHKLTSKTDKLKQVLQLMSEKPSLPYPENSKILPWVAKLEATCK